MNMLARDGDSSASEDDFDINIGGQKVRGDSVNWQTLATFANSIDALAYMSKPNLTARGHKIGNKNKNKHSLTWHSKSKKSPYMERIIMIHGIVPVELQHNGVIDLNHNDDQGGIDLSKAQTLQIDAYRELGITGGKAVTRRWLHEHPELVPPIPSKIDNRNAYMRRVIKEENAIVSMEDIDEYCRANGRNSLDVNDPSHEDKAFIVDHEINDEDEYPKFRIVISTLRCLGFQLPDGDSMMNADATYRILREKCPIFLIGFSDMDKVFHPVLIGIASNETADDFKFFFKVWKENHIGQVELQIKFIMLDGAAAMHNGAQRIWADIIRTMCFAHVHLVSNYFSLYMQPKGLN